MHLFHYHLVTSRVREVEARYIGKLGFDLVARHGRIGEDLTSYEPGMSWTELDAIGFKLRLSELELGAVNVVVQPGQWPLPRVDHLGLALDEDEFEARSRAPTRRSCACRSTAAAGRSSRRTPATGSSCIRRATGSTSCSSRSDRLRLSELHLKADDPEAKAAALAEVLDCERIGADVEVGETLVRFVPGGPQGRPELHAELFV